MQDTLCELFGIVIFIGDSSPEEHTRLMGIILAAQHAHDFLCHRSALAVRTDVGLHVPLLGVVIGLCGSQLQGTEGARIYIALHLQYPRHELCVGGQHAHTPSGHIVAFGHRVELYAAFLGTWYLQDAEFLSLVEDEAIGVVIHHHDIVVACKLHQMLIGLLLCWSSCGHIRIVGPHQLHSAEVHLFQCFKVGLPSVLWQQVIVDHLGSQQIAQTCIGGISGIGNQNLFAWVYEGECHMQDALLAAYQRLYLTIGIQCHVIPSLIESGHSLTQFGCAHCGLIAVHIWSACLLTQHLYSLLGRRHVGTAYGQRDDILSFGIESGHFLAFAAEVIFVYRGQALCWLHIIYFVFHLYILPIFSVHSPAD